jgi:hypothetical protein
MIQFFKENPNINFVSQFDLWFSDKMPSRRYVLFLTRHITGNWTPSPGQTTRSSVVCRSGRTLFILSWCFITPISVILEHFRYLHCRRAVTVFSKKLQNQFDNCPISTQDYEVVFSVVVRPVTLQREDYGVVRVVYTRYWRLE